MSFLWYWLSLWLRLYVWFVLSCSSYCYLHHQAGWEYQLQMGTLHTNDQTWSWMHRDYCLKHTFSRSIYQLWRNELYGAVVVQKRGGAWEHEQRMPMSMWEMLACSLPGCDIAFTTVVCSKDGALFTLKSLSEQREGFACSYWCCHLTLNTHALFKVWKLFKRICYKDSACLNLD